MIVLLIFTSGYGLFCWRYLQNYKPNIKISAKIEPTKKQIQPKPIEYYSPLAGTKVSSISDMTKPITGIMIENTPNARPQSGLKQAEVVYEAIAEGGITRFLALYQQNKPQLIGPVRSLRPYYIDWLKPYNASIAHVGGSSNALKEIRNGSYRDIDYFLNYGYYWRSTDRYAPHNVYTSFSKLDKLNNAKGYTSSNPTGLKRDDNVKLDQGNINQINILISDSLYNSVFYYNNKTNSYDRYQDGSAHMDREDGQISPSVVIVLKINMKTVMEDGWREDYNTIGSGNAYVFENGGIKSANWYKNSQDDQLHFFDTNNSNIELSLARGQTWIIALPVDETVTWK